MRLRLLTSRQQIFLAAVITMSAIIAMLAYGPAARAAEHVIEMRNKDNAGQTMAFEPSFLKVEVGDSVKFVPADKGHNAESVTEVWPEGAPFIKGAFNAEVVFKAEKEGLYAVKCLPHFGMGMVALVQAGKPANLEKMKAYKAPGVSQKRLAAALEKVVP
jgi:pseudoazurin